MKPFVMGVRGEETMNTSRAFQLSFSTDNAAFEQPAVEVIRILRQLANEIEADGIGDRYVIVDLNGNTVGTARFIF